MNTLVSTQIDTPPFLLEPSRYYACHLLRKSRFSKKRMLSSALEVWNLTFFSQWWQYHPFFQGLTWGKSCDSTIPKELWGEVCGGNFWERFSADRDKEGQHVSECVARWTSGARSCVSHLTATVAQAWGQKLRLWGNMLKAWVCDVTAEPFN